MGTDIDPEEEEEYSYAPASRGEAHIFEMRPLRAAGFVAPAGEFYHIDYKADESLAKKLCRKYFNTDGDTSSLLLQRWLVISDDGMVNQVSAPSYEQIRTLQKIVTVVEDEVTLPDEGEREEARLYLQNIKDVLTRFEKSMG